MLRHSVVLMASLALIAAPADAQERTADRIFPETTVGYVEISDPPALLSAIFDHPLRAKIEALEPWQQAIRTDGYRQFLIGRKFVEVQLGAEWREALETFTAHGIYAGVDAATQGVVILVHSADAESLDLYREKLLAISQLGDNPDSIREAEYRSITAYEINKSKFAVVDDWLVITNKAETGKAVIDQLLDGDRATLADNAAYQEARKTCPPDSSAWAFVDLKTLREAGVAKQLFAGKSGNPAVELLIGGILSSLQQTPFATAHLRADVSGLSLAATLPHDHAWVPEERVFYFGPDGKGAGPALPALSDTLFTLATWRDISEMWLRAGDLFDRDINDGFAEADANLTTLFAGRDFGEDILGSITPQIGLIATKQNFQDVLPIPAIRLPQFALVMQLREPETMTREFRRTFQSMIGFFNVLGAMEGRPQLEMNMEAMDNGARLVTSVYIPEKDDAESTEADLIFNFSPSVAFVGKHFIVSSTAGLARELSGAEFPVDERPGANTTASLKADVLQAVLTDNQEQLISQNMLEEGHSREEAEAAISLLLQLIGYFEDVSLKLDVASDTVAAQVDLRIQQE